LKEENNGEVIIGMLGLVLYNFGKAAFVDVPSILLQEQLSLPSLKKSIFLIFFCLVQYSRFSSLGLSNSLLSFPVSSRAKPLLTNCSHPESAFQK